MTSYSSDDDVLSQSSEGSTYPRGFVALIVTGENAVQQFEEAYPTHYNRCFLAKNIDRTNTLSTPQVPIVHPFQVRLEQFPDWHVGAGLEEFVNDLIPESMRAHRGVYNVSDWDCYDYWENTTATSSPATGPVQWEASPDALELDGTRSTISSPMKKLKCDSTESSPQSGSIQQKRKRGGALPTAAQPSQSHYIEQKAAGFST